LEYSKDFQGREDYGTSIVTFPFSYPQGTLLAKDVTALDQLKLIRMYQTLWSDNAVSCTVYYTKEELPSIKTYLLKNYDNSVKSVSFLLRNDAGFHQAPFEEISKEAYDELVRTTKPLTRINCELELSEDDECGRGGCPVR
jgi:hypothetical protein